MVKSSVFSVEIPGVTLEEILGFFQKPEHFVDYHRESNGNDHVRVGRWKKHSPSSAAAAVEASAAALDVKSKKKAAPAAPAAPAVHIHPACEPLNRDVAFLVSFRAPAWFKKAVGTETVKVRDCHDLVAQVDGEPTPCSSLAPSAAVPKLESIIMRSQPRLWLPTAGTELKIAEITFDVSVKPEVDEEAEAFVDDDGGESSRGVRLADTGKPSTSSSSVDVGGGRRVAANDPTKPTLVMRATVVACCDSMKWLVGLKSTVERIMLYQCEVMASSFIEWVSRRAREEYDGAEPTRPRPPAGPLPPISLPPPLRSLRNRQLSLPGEPSWDGGVSCGGAAGPILGGSGAAVAAAAAATGQHRRASGRGGGLSRNASCSRPTSAGGETVFYDAMDSVPSSPLAVPTPETVAAAQLLGSQLSLGKAGAKHAREEAEAILAEAEAEAAGEKEGAGKISAGGQQRGLSRLAPKARNASIGAAHVSKLRAGGDEQHDEGGERHASKRGRGLRAPTKGGSGNKLVRSFRKMWT